MLYILLTVIISVFLLLLFKVFPKFGVNTFAAIIFNYAAASCTGIIFTISAFSFSDIYSAPWIKLSVPLGALFILVFYLISLTTQRINVATASVANKMSVAMPVLFSVFFLNQELSVYKVIGIILALIAVYLSSKSSDHNSNIKKLIWLPILVFIGSGLIDIAINAANAFYIKTNNDSALFSISIFSSAFIIGLIAFAYSVFAKKPLAKELFKGKNILAGIVLGVPNYFSIYFTFKSLESEVLNSARLFPVLNLSNVVLSAILGWLLFKEKLSVINVIGITIAAISIILIAL